MPVVDSCCRCCTLKTGTIVSGVLGVIIGLATLLLVLLSKVNFKTIVMDWLPQEWVRAILAINLIMTMLISCFLIVGAVKRNRWFMLPWVVLAIIIAVGLVISVLYTSITMFIAKEILNGCLWLIVGLLFNAIFIYLWVVVFSYFQLITEEKNRGPYGRPVYKT